MSTSDPLTRRERQCLRRIMRGQTTPDTDALKWLARKGLLSLPDESKPFDNSLTEAGRTACQALEPA